MKKLLFISLMTLYSGLTAHDGREELLQQLHQKHLERIEWIQAKAPALSEQLTSVTNDIQHYLEPLLAQENERITNVRYQIEEIITELQAICAPFEKELTELYEQQILPLEQEAHELHVEGHMKLADELSAQSEALQQELIEPLLHNVEIVTQTLRDQLESLQQEEENIKEEVNTIIAAHHEVLQPLFEQKNELEEQLQQKLEPYQHELAIIDQDLMELYQAWYQV